MRTGWSAFHARAGALRQVMEELDRDAGADLVWDAERAAVFADPDDLLLGLHEVWTRRLLGRVDLRLELDGTGGRDAVSRAWHEVATELPGVRRMLDRHEGDAVLARLDAHEHRMLAVAAGLAALGDRHAEAASRGRDLVAAMRCETPPAAPRRRPGPLAALLVCVAPGLLGPRP